uniref:Uncharacterized protein n=1 Tax=Strigamia maritima TaxID=126957 RepID=T1J048_STRMM
MAWLESCMCFDLFTASIVVGLVTVVIYLVAFAVELWWIIDSNASLPIPAYILCVGYFIIFFTSVIMIAGMIGQASKCLLVWLFVIVILFVPEGGIVLFMSIIHWTLRHKYGLTELIFWVCRAVLDIIAVIVVQSQYSTWKNNKQVLQRLQSLHLTGAITDTVLKDGQFSNGYLPSTTTTGAYENLGFISTTDIRPSATNSQLPPLSNTRMQRSLSSASQLQPTHQNSLHNGGSLPTDRMHLHDWPYLQTSRTTGTLNSSNNSNFDPAVLAARYSFPVKSSTSIERQPSDLQSYRPRSLMYLDEDDYLTRPPPSRAVSLGYVNLHPAAYSTQSLDRSKFLRMAGRRRTTSLDALDMRMRPDVQLQKVAMEPFDYLNRPGSKSDLDNVEDNLPNLNDVAL